MDYSADFGKVKDLVETSTTIAIVSHEHPTFDSIGSSLALYIGLTGMGKKVSVICPDPMTVGLSGFIGVNKVITGLGNKNFIISLDYVEGSIDKVSYNIEGNMFHLVIEPREGFNQFSKDKVHFSTGSMPFDMVFAVDTIHPGGFGKLETEIQELLKSNTIVNIDRHPNNAQYGQVNIVQADASSTAELIAQTLSVLGIKLNSDMASNILNALFDQTSNFQNPYVNERTFELASVCMKAGGKRFAKKDAEFSGPDIRERGEEPPVKEPVRQTPNPQEPGTPTGQEPKHPPSEWLKPKIFKSSTIA